MRAHLACINFLSATLLQLIRAAAVNPEAYTEAAAVRNSNQEVQVVYELLEGNDSLWVVGDRQVCEQAATNLLSNAVKYGGGKPLKMHFQQSS